MMWPRKSARGRPITSRSRVIGRKDRALEGEHTPRYLCLQRKLPGGDKGAEKPSPAQMQAMYAKFNEWREKFQANLTDLGGKLGAGRLVTTQPPPDGPLVEIKELVGGYMIVSATSLEE